MTAPMIVWDNRLADAVPVASSTASGAAINLADFRPYTNWKPSAMPATVTVDCVTAHSANCLAVFNHDLGSKGAVVEVRGSTDNFVTSDVLVATKHVSSDYPFIQTFTSASYRYWRAKLMGCHNLLAYSEQFDNAAWAKIASSVTANTVTAPDGTLTADTITEDTANNLHDVRQNVSTVIGAKYTHSAYIRKGDARYVVTAVQGTTGVDYAQIAIDLDLRTATMVYDPTNVIVAGSITFSESVGGWARISFSYTASVATYAFILGLLNATGTTAFYTGSSRLVYVWGAQFEQNTSASTYIPTTSAAVTNAPTLSTAALGVSLPLEIGVPFGFDPLQRTVFGSTNISEQGLPLGKSVLFEQWSQSINLGFVTNTWLRNAFLPAWKAHLRGNPFLFAFDNTTYPTEIYLVESDGNLNTPTVAPDYSGLSFSIKGVALP